MSSESQMIASFRLTKYLYYRAILDCGYSYGYNGGWSTRIVIIDSDDEKRDMVSHRYLQLILTCSDKTLKAILDAAEANICRRAGKTLEAIKTELFERVMNEEDSSKTKTINAS